VQGLEQFGWTEGRNARIDIRWAAGEVGRFRQYATELVALAPQVILANSSQSVAALLQATRTVPIVFAGIADPSAPASSTASRDLAATPLAFCCSSTA